MERRNYTGGATNRGGTVVLSEIEQANGWSGAKGHTSFRVTMRNRDGSTLEHTSTFRSAAEARLFWLQQHQVDFVESVEEVKDG